MGEHSEMGEPVGEIRLALFTFALGNRRGIKLPFSFHRNRQGHSSHQL